MVSLAIVTAVGAEVGDAGGKEAVGTKPPLAGCGASAGRAPSG